MGDYIVEMRSTVIERYRVKADTRDEAILAVVEFDGIGEPIYSETWDFEVTDGWEDKS